MSETISMRSKQLLDDLAKSLQFDGWQNAHVDLRNGTCQRVHLINVAVDSDYEPHTTADAVLEHEGGNWREIRKIKCDDDFSEEADAQ